MANWLAKILPTAAQQSVRNLPAVVRRQLDSTTAPGDKLPNASVVYGIAASALLVVALFFLFAGHWVSGLLVLLPAGCFLGFALHFLKHPD